MSARQQVVGKVLNLAARLARCEPLHRLQILEESGTGHVIGRQRLTDALNRAESSLKEAACELRGVADSLPVPLPEPAPADGWEQWALVDRSKPKELQLIGFFDSEGEATAQISQFNMAGELLKVVVLPSPPVVEGKP